MYIIDQVWQIDLSDPPTPKFPTNYTEKLQVNNFKKLIFPFHIN